MTKVITIRIGEDMLCNECNTPIQLRKRVNTEELAEKNRGYYTEWYKCPGCKRVWLEECNHVWPSA